MFITECPVCMIRTKNHADISFPFIQNMLLSVLTSQIFTKHIQEQEVKTDQYNFF